MGDSRQIGQGPFAIEAIFEDHTGSVLKGVVVNISMGGVYIETDHPIPHGMPLSLSLDLTDAGSVECINGKVVRSDPGHGMAVEFEGKDNKEVKDLIEMVKDIIALKCNKDACLDEESVQ